MKKLVIVWMSVLSMMGAAANATTYDVATTSGVERSKDSVALPFQTDFPLNSNVYAFVTVGDVVENSALPQALEARWYSCGKLVYQRSLSLDEKALKQSAKSKGDHVHKAWFWLGSNTLGSGDHKVEIYSSARMVASTNFNVLSQSGAKTACPSEKTTYTLSDAKGKDVLFQFNKSEESDLNPGAQIQLDKIAQDMRSKYKSISSMTVEGYTDRLGSDAHNMVLSQKRAETIKNALLRRGVVADQVNVVGLGPSAPLTNCPSSLGRQELIDCLAPDRRIAIKVTGEAFIKAPM